MSLRWTIRMAGTNLEVQSLYIPRPVSPCAIPLLIPSLFSVARSSAIFVEPPPGIPHRRLISVGEARSSSGAIS
jgi:hypothetical protein